MEINMVELGKGKYAIRRKLFFGGYEYHSTVSDYWWDDPVSVLDFCVGDYDTIKELYDILTGGKKIK